MRMTIGSLFSGIGGLELGLEWAGLGPTVWQVEKDDYCRRVLAKHWPSVPRFEDVRDVGAHNLAPVDVICGGPPCQPTSLAGHRLGENDERWLWHEYFRIVRELRPRYAVMENVPGLLSLGMGRVLGGLADIGYDAEWSVLSACAVGAPHARERVFILAYPAGSGRAEVLPRGASVGHAADRRWAAGHAHPRAGAAERLSALERVCGEPALLGAADGAPEWMDRLGALGNAVVPQVTEYIGRLIVAAEAAQLETRRAA